MFGLIVWGWVVSLLSLVPAWSFIELFLFLNIALTVFFAFESPTVTLLRKMSLVFASAQLVYIVRDMLNYVFIMVSGDKLDVWGIVDGFSNIRFYAQFLSWTLPFLIGFIAVNSGEKYRKIFIGVAVLSWMLVLVSGTRAFILGILFSLVSVLWIMPILWKRYATWVFLTGVGGAIGYIALIFVLPAIFGIDNSSALNSTVDRNFGSSSGRVQIWIDTLNVALANPYTGIGPMMTAVDGVLQTVAHPHNFPLQLMAEWGIPFAVVFISFVIYITFKWKSLIHENPVQRGEMALPVTAAVSSAAAAGLVDGLMVMPVSLLYMSVILGFGAALWRTWMPQVSHWFLPFYVKAVLLIPVWILAVVTVIQWGNIVASDQITGFSPRFWQNGKIKMGQSLFSADQTEHINVVFK